MKNKSSLKKQFSIGQLVLYNKIPDSPIFSVLKVEGNQITAISEVTTIISHRSNFKHYVK